MISRIFQFILLLSFGLMSFISGPVLSHNATGVGDKSDRIYWSQYNRLTWDDFKGSPDYRNKFASAISSTGIIYRYKCERNIIKVTVECMFIKSESWVKDAALTDYHLQHEQLHFDITELYARKLRKELSQQIFVCGDEYKLERLVSNKLQEWDNEQKVYDKQTHHSLNEEKQVVWNEFVATELAMYAKYSSDIYNN